MIDNEKVYKKLLNKVMSQPILSNGTREIINAHAVFNVNKPLKRAYESYKKAELEWYTSQDLCIKNHPIIETNPIWQNCATADGHVNSNYGWCVWSKENGAQFEHAVESLMLDKWSRQSVCIYIRPEMHKHFNDNIHAKKDFICTFETQHFIRDNKLEYLVYMRSNDIEHGTPYDLYWHQHLYSEMLNVLRMKYSDLQEGSIHWNAGSLHKYES